MSHLPALNIALPIGTLEAYIARVNQIELLTAEEEFTLATRFQIEKDLEAAKKLVLTHLRFVVRVARGYMGYGLALGDLIQEGNIGLMKAVKRFDPNVGVRLVSFAVHWVKAEIHEFILRNWRIVKIATTKAQRKLFFNLRKAAKRLGWFSEEEISTVARDLNVSAEEVRRMEMRLNAHHESFDAPIDEETGEAHFAPEQYLEDQRYNPALQLEAKDWSHSREQALQHAMANLDARSQDILRSRWLVEEKATLHDLAAKYRISAERVRQIEKLAMERLKSTLA
ncbi:MAG: RNA polymerase sigma factor RpoH [Gammaproteobacteria bacterium]